MSALELLPNIVGFVGVGLTGASLISKLFLDRRHSDQAHTRELLIERSLEELGYANIGAITAAIPVERGSSEYEVLAAALSQDRVQGLSEAPISTHLSAQDRANVLATLLKSIDSVDNAVLCLGTLVIVKAGGLVTMRELSDSELLAWELKTEDPAFIRAPDQVVTWLTSLT